jgi:alkanesulfonate monooxygenase SsuD/methylene tetrahydromethanopterin reductase-like flavin-dependent oxidoreductase (luciferase family)
MFAHQWGSLDVLSEGRSLLAVCLGGPNEQSAAQALEHQVMGIQANERVARMEVVIVILSKVFHVVKASHKGRFYEFEGLTIHPHRVQNPCPIWIACNPTGLTWRDGASASEAVIERSLRRVARYADGWMTNKVTPEQFQGQWSRIKSMAREEGRDPTKLSSALYHNVNVNEDRAAALADAKTFLDKYYSSNFSPKFVEGFTTAGGPEQCIAELKGYFAAGLDHITLRMASWNQAGQFKRFVEEVAPAFGSRS